MRKAVLIACVAGAWLCVGASTALASNPACPSAASSTATSCTFDYTGAQQVFTVPAGLAEVRITTIGALGGVSSAVMVPAADGADVAATVAVPVGATDLYVEVGGDGSSSGAAAFNGGGASGESAGAGGGGASDVRTCSVTVCTNLGTNDTRLVVAGGGGGEGNQGAAGGSAGHSAVTGPGPGGNGSDSVAGTAGGNGGLNGSAGGAGGTGSGSYPFAGGVGTLGQGGAAPTNNDIDNMGGGGGGGYWGGGAGGDADSDGGGGGAGSSHWTSGATSTSSVTDSTGTPDVIITEISSAPAITSVAHSSFDVGSHGSFAVTTTGFPTAALSETGALPGGVTLVDNSNGTATLSGTPASGSAGAYPITIKASNGVAPDATQSFTLTAVGPPGAAISAPADGGSYHVGQAVATSFSCTDDPAGPGIQSCIDSRSVAGSAGVNGFTGAGQLDTSTVGTHTYTITATSQDGQTGTASISYAVWLAPSITSGASTTFQVGTQGSFTVTSTGDPTAALSETGALPGGVTLVDNSNGTATLSGTPASGSAGAYPITIKASNGVAPDATQSFTLTAVGPPSANIVSPPGEGSYHVGQAVATSFSCTDDPAGPGIQSCTDSNNAAGTAGVNGFTGAGQLNTSTVGTHTYTITATSQDGQSATSSISYAVWLAPAITSSASTTVDVGTHGSFTVTTTGDPTAALSETGALPGGVTLVDNSDGTATLSGTPASGSAGAYPITIKASNGVAPDATQSFTLTAVGPPGAAISAPAGGGSYHVGQAVTTSFSCTDDPAGPGIQSCTDSNNAAGSAGGDGFTGAGQLDTSTVGTHTYTITATSQDGQTGTASISYTVNPLPTCSDVAASTDAGHAVTVDLSCIDASDASLTFGIVSGAAHGTLGAVDQSTGTTSYMPAGGYSGNDSFTYNAESSNGTAVTKTVRITVDPPSPPASPTTTTTPTRSPSPKPVTPPAQPSKPVAVGHMVLIKLITGPGGTLVATVRLPSAGVLQGKLMTALGNFELYASGEVTLVRAKKVIAGASTIVLRLIPSVHARRMIAAHHKARVSFVLVFTPQSGQVSTVHLSALHLPTA